MTSAVRFVMLLFVGVLYVGESGLFQAVLSMSLTASVVILAVLLARLALRRAPKVFSYALWAVVLFRLLCPISLSSPLSVVQPVQMAAPAKGATMDAWPGSTNTAGVPVQVGNVPAHDPGPAVTSAPAAVPDAPSVPEPDLPLQAAKPLPDLWPAAGVIWLAGTALLLGYSALSLLRLRRRLVGSVPLAGEKNVRLADHIPSPFVLGLVRPKIYLPSDLPEDERDYILLHERTHIRRKDHIFRALAWLALSIHWFNPLVWLAFHLAGKDMEMSCDEAVLRNMGRDVRADYSTSLLRLSVGGKLPAGPLAFGGGDPQSRIKNVLSYKKPAFWVVAAALIGVLCAGVALATDQSTPLINPDSVVSVTAIKGPATYTTTPQNTGIFTAADRRKTLSDSSRAYSLTDEKGAELVRLLNQYRRTVYTRGEPEELSGWTHGLTRIDCADGSFYAVDYWYWNGFSFNPFHGGEDDYTTLVTYYNAQGNAEITWQMEYDFDPAYSKWRGSLRLPPWRYDMTELVLGGYAPAYRLSDIGTVFIYGMGGAYLEYDASAYGGLGGMIFSENPGAFCPPLMYKTVWEGDAHYEDETTLAVSFSVTDQRVEDGKAPAFHLAFTVDLVNCTALNWEFRSEIEGETLELMDWEMVETAQALAALMQGARDCYESSWTPPSYPPYMPAESDLTFSYVLNELGSGVYINGLDCGGAVWQNSEVTLSAHVYEPEKGALGILRITNPRFLGGYFANAYGSAAALYYPEESSPTLALVFDDYTASVSDPPGLIAFVVDLGTKQVKSLDISGYPGQAPEFSDEDLVEMARALAGMIQGASYYYADASNPAPESGPLPFEQPLRLWFGSGAGAWRTIITLHPDGSFEGNYNDSDMGVVGEDYPMGTEAVCIFHGKFGDIEQVSAASWSMTLEELTLDTGHHPGEKWIAERTRYVAAQPYGFDCEAGGTHPGISFMLYTPEAKGYASDDELYGMSEDNESTVSIKRQLWNWWPDRHDWTPDSTLSCYALCNMETGYGFFDLTAWGIAPEQPRDY